MIPRILFIAILIAGAARAHTLESVLREMDRAAAAFQTVTAHIRIVKYTAIVKDETADEGTIWVKRVKPRVSRLVIEFTLPDRYYLRLTEKKAEIYRPKIATVEEYDISRHRELAGQLWLLSFGAAGRDLASRYQMSFKGEEKVAGQPVVKLELIPRSAQLLENIPRIELWISTEHWQPVQQKFHEVTAGDYRLYTYTGLKWNAAFPDSRLELPLQPGVRRQRR